MLAPHGSICVELGDTYAGSGGAGGDYAEGGIRDGQHKFRARTGNGGSGWPLPKSLTGIPTLYAWSLAYGRNLLTGEESPAGQWRVRNVLCWARPNPPVGALGDKFRPATSYITVACKGRDRWFDLDAVRTPLTEPGRIQRRVKGSSRDDGWMRRADAITQNPIGAPPLDWHADDHPEDGDWLWRLPTQPYKGAHYATFPEALPRRLIEAMCPLEVCTRCGEPRRRVSEVRYEAHGDRSDEPKGGRGKDANGEHAQSMALGQATRVVTGSSWTTCDCADTTYRPGVVLDPFAGSGTTLAASIGVGRYAIGIDLDERNADLARERCGMFLEVAS